MFNKKIFNRLNDIYHGTLDEMDSISDSPNAGGEIRNKNGDFGERFVDEIIREVNKNEGEDFICKVGDESLQTCIHGNYRQEVQVDRHIFKPCISNTLKFVLGIEVKSYFDLCYAKRACQDFAIIKRIHNTSKTVVFTFEQACSVDAYNFWNSINNNPIDECFVMLEGVRRSDRPNYKKKFRKNLIYDNVKNFYNYISEIKGE